MQAYNLEVTPKGVDKVSRYGWTVKDNQGEFKRLPKWVLKINNETYQRDAIKGKVLELASNWSWIACGAITVAHRDGEYWVVDGQHRKLAADRRSDIKELPCLVFEVESVKGEAQAFLDTNGNRKPVTSYAKFRAKLAMGDTNAELVAAVIRDAGLHICSSGSEARGFSAFAMGEKLAADDFEAFRNVMLLCGELAVEDNAGLHSRVLAGLYYINRRIPEGVLNTRFRKRIKQFKFSELVNAANKAAAYYGQAGSKVCADGIMTLLNHGLHNKLTLGE